MSVQYVTRKTSHFFPASLFLCALVYALSACDPKEPPAVDGGDLSQIPYDPQPYKLVKPDSFPLPPIPADNPMTVAGVQLGRRLFYDKILSGDSTQSCSSCHLPSGNFSDNKRLSTGIDGIAGRRSAMALLDIAYANKGLFWDGRSATLEAQALLPVEDPIEMHAKWTDVIVKLQRHPDYPALFRKAFGIDNRKEITKELAAKAIAQFERILISSGKSKYDLWREKKAEFTDDELDGYIMFFDRGRDLGLNLPDAQCFHCHGGETFTTNGYFNNGLDNVASLEDFKDKGRGEVSGNRFDNGKFRSPSLRNIALSAPYMHDGRFNTLFDVLDHYSKNGTKVENEDPFIRQIGFPIPGSNPVRYSGLNDAQKKAIVAFLNTLTDMNFVNNPDIQNPFQ